jgi:nucleotide-binding universal stress UspA family protein
MNVRTRRDATSHADVDAGGARPVMLATLGVPFVEAAVEVAVDGAVESGQPLLVVNVTRLEPLSLSLLMGYDALEEFTPEVSASTRRPAEIAAGFGLQVERLRVRSPRPVTALLELARERRPGLLVFGPDPSRLSARRFRKAAEALRANVSCLVWIAGESDWQGPRSVG